MDTNPHIVKALKKARKKLKRVVKKYDRMIAELDEVLEENTSFIGHRISKRSSLNSHRNENSVAIKNRTKFFQSCDRTSVKIKRQKSTVQLIFQGRLVFP